MSVKTTTKQRKGNDNVSFYLLPKTQRAASISALAHIHLMLLKLLSDCLTALCLPKQNSVHLPGQSNAADILKFVSGQQTDAPVQRIYDASGMLFFCLRCHLTDEGQLYSADC